MNLGTVVLIALAILLFTPLSRIALAAVFGRSIGRAALERQPDTIHLKPVELAKLRHAERVESLANAYAAVGFADAGLFTIPEMPGVHVRLLANTRESLYAAIYDHPVAGVFYDVVSRAVDGSSWTFTTARPTGIKHRDDAHMTNLPGAEPGALVTACLRARPGTGLQACSTSTAVRDFETAYAEYIAWMKHRGLSTGEVVDVARRKVA
jgi:hypothetical protein